MLILSGFAIDMALNADPELDCSKIYTQTVVWAITAVCFLRCLHLFAILLFLLCCLPCYLCDDKCFAKAWLVKGKATSRATIANLQTQWSWNHDDTLDD